MGHPADQLISVERFEEEALSSEQEQSEHTMTGRITGAVKYGKSLAFLMESSIIVTHDNGKEPNEWPKELFFAVGTNDEFVRQFANEFIELMDATSILTLHVSKLRMH